MVTAPTCTAAGYTTYTCSVCGDTYVADEVAALGHTEAVDTAVAPTCTETGLTEGKHCSVCNEVLVAQTVVDALGHSYDDDADATCNVCGDVREVATTEEATTEEPTTEEETTEEVTTEEVTSEEATTEEVKQSGGCSGSVSLMGIALVATLGTCAVFATKKKNEEE